MTQDVSQSLQQALALYGRRSFEAAGKACEHILATLPDEVDALYLSGLCQCQTGSPNIGIRSIKQAVALRPSLENFDIQRDWLIRRGIANQIALWESRFFEYRLFQSVDAFVLSYPKCGRTWLRALLGKYVLGPGGEGDPLEILNLTAADPDFCTLHFSHDDNPHWKPADKQYTNKQAYADKKVIFLARDPRDALVSYYFQYTRRDDRKHANDATFNGTLSDFIRHDIGGLGPLVRFYNVWAANRTVPQDFLLVTYEDMQKDVRKVLRDIASFLSWPERDATFLDEVVSFGSFDNMRKLEETNALNNARLRAPDDGDPESFKVRKGKVGGYTEYLTEADERFIDDYLTKNLDDFFGRYKQGA